MTPSPTFTNLLEMILGIALIAFGQLMFWLNMIKEWEPPSEPMKMVFPLSFSAALSNMPSSSQQPLTSPFPPPTLTTFYKSSLP